MGMIIENNEKWTELREELKIISRILEFIYELRGETLVIYWTTGGRHMRGSLHYKGRAFDFKPTEKDREKFVRRLKYIFGKDYDIIDEGDHFHIEWDPKI